MNTDRESLGGASDAMTELRERLASRFNRPFSVYERSVRTQDGRLFGLIRLEGNKYLVVCGGDPAGFETVSARSGSGTALHLCRCTPENAQRLREVFSWTSPEPLGRTSAIGCGDRLGCATPGHIRACRAAGIRPVLAQQSIREMERTGRSPQQVLDDVSWAVFQEGYTGGFGADADHLKTKAEIESCVEAGYTMYTIDPSDHVQNDADRLEGSALTDRFRALPWDELKTTPQACIDRYTPDSILVEGAEREVQIEFDADALKRSAVKYGAAIAHTRALARHLAAQYEAHRAESVYDLEMSVDETATPTRPHEHYFVAAELRRLDVSLTSLAPRFVGDFEKGIDYIGDLDAFEDAFRTHAIIAEANGGYKLSIHSGSDKFSVFPIIGRYAGDRVHLKTAGTSFLEALRIPARHAPDFFRDVVRVAFRRFEVDRKTYHVSTDLDVVPQPGTVADEALERVYLEENNARQLLHITYGSILSARTDGEIRFKDILFDLLDEWEEEHFEVLESHFLDHIESLRGRLGT